jgi:hypothetical protein
MLKIDIPTKKTLLGINLHNPIWLLLQSTSIDHRPGQVLTDFSPTLLNGKWKLAFTNSFPLYTS